MANTAKKKLGIIGGLGPAATASLFMRIIDHTDAKTDQDHLDITILKSPPDSRQDGFYPGEKRRILYSCRARSGFRAGAHGLRSHLHALRHGPL